MSTSDDSRKPLSNRDKEVEGRSKRRRFVQGTRAYTHALTNSIAKRAAGKHPNPAALPGPKEKSR